MPTDETAKTEAERDREVGVPAGEAGAADAAPAASDAESTTPASDADGTPADSAEPNEKRRKLPSFINLNTATAIMLTICALTTAWANWISDLHNSDQDSNYALAQRLNTEADASYNLCSQTYIAAFNVWSSVYLQNVEANALEANGEHDEATAKKQAMTQYIETNCPDYQSFKQEVYSALEKGGTATPFDAYPQEKFFEESEQISNQATQVREDGDWNNLASDSFGLVAVFYSLCLFLFGMVGFYKHLGSRKIVFAAGCIVFVIATVYMLSLPLPKNFNFANYFKFFN